MSAAWSNKSSISLYQQTLSRQQQSESPPLR
jgi:hypothetical protein